MLPKIIQVSSAARRLIEEKGIDKVTFDLKMTPTVGCCIKNIKEIEPIYEEPENKAKYWTVKVDRLVVYISRRITILRPLKLVTDGLWKFKRLALHGVSIPL